MAIPFFQMLFSRVLVTALFFLLFIAQMDGQVKYEKEERIKTEDLPAVISSSFQAIPKGKKGKWYKETGLKSESYEYKAIYFKRQYSIEFSADGTLEDVEILLKKKDISDAVLEVVCEALRPQYQDFRVLKTQIQIRPPLAELSSLLSMPPPLDDRTNTFELVVEVDTENGSELREILLSEESKIHSSKKIISGNQDNLEF